MEHAHRIFNAPGSHSTVFHLFFSKCHTLSFTLMLLLLPLCVCYIYDFFMLCFTFRFLGHCCGDEKRNETNKIHTAELLSSEPQIGNFLTFSRSSGTADSSRDFHPPTTSDFRPTHCCCYVTGPKHTHRFLPQDKSICNRKRKNHKLQQNPPKRSSQDSPTLRAPCAQDMVGPFKNNQGLQQFLRSTRVAR